MRTAATPLTRGGADAAEAERRLRQEQSGADDGRRERKPARPKIAATAPMSASTPCRGRTRRCRAPARRATRRRRAVAAHDEGERRTRSDDVLLTCSARSSETTKRTRASPPLDVMTSSFSGQAGFRSIAPLQIAQRNDVDSLCRRKAHQAENDDDDDVISYQSVGGAQGGDATVQLRRLRHD